MLSYFQLPAEVRFSYFFFQPFLYFLSLRRHKNSRLKLKKKNKNNPFPQAKTELSVTLDSRSQSWSGVGGSKLQSLEELESP